MKPHRVKALLLWIGSFLLPLAALSQVTTTYEDGDLFLGFRATGATNNYLIKIGPPSQFRDAAAGSAFTLNLGNTAADLAAVFGANWFNRTDLFYAIIGGRFVGDGTDTDNTVYSSNPTLSRPWPRRSSNAQSATTTLTDELGTNYAGNQSTANSNIGLIQPAAAENSYAAYQPGGGKSGGISFQAFNPTNEGIPTQTLFFNRILPGAGSAVGTPSQVIGSFDISSSGSVTFTAGAPTPTPTPIPTPTPVPTPTPTPGFTPTPTPTVSPGPSPTPTPTISPSPGPISGLGNISTRVSVGTGDNALIGGFIIAGNRPKKVILRSLGSSLAQKGVPGALADSTLQMFDSFGHIFATNDNWADGIDRQAIIDSRLAPEDEREAALLLTLSPGSYTAIARGKNDTTGIALLEVFDLDPSAATRLVNLSSRGFVDLGDRVMIGGFIVGGGAGSSTRVVARAIGPSLEGAGVSNSLQDPLIELRDANGGVLALNNNWKDSQEAEIRATGLPPTDERESAIVARLTPDNYTVIVRGANGSSGVGLVEIFNVP